MCKTDFKEKNKEYHDFSRYFRVNTTVARIRMKRKQAGRMHHIPPGKKPFELINIDYLGPFASLTRGNKYTIIRNLTTFYKLYACKDKKAPTSVKRVE